MSERSLRIVWLGPAPGEDGGVPGVASELLLGLADLGHRIDCFFPSSGQEIPLRLAGNQNITVTWGTGKWQWDRWYSRARIGALVSGLLVRALASLRLRRQILRRHRTEPYDLIYQFSSIESLAVPPRLTRTVPLVIHPETHAAGELRALIAERRLSLRSQALYRFAAVASIMLMRSLVQRRRIRRARLLVCISAVFREHLVRDYGFPREQTVVVPNPVRLERFSGIDGQPHEPPRVLVLGRIAVRKGIEDVVALAHELLRRGEHVQIRVVGGPSLWSDYTPLLEALPAENSQYVGSVAPAEIATELASSDLLVQASSYEPFALTVAEALAAGRPVVATSEVGAIEQVDRSVAAEVAPGDIQAMATAVVETLERARRNPEQMSSTARAEAQRLFAPQVVCGQISLALERLVERDAEHAVPAPAGPARRARPASPRRPP
jgi:glycosyltransferase involved in cell wall biosynthesis